MEILKYIICFFAGYGIYSFILDIIKIIREVIK